MTSLIFILFKALSEMTELLSSRSNYINYRRVYNECTGFKVPILGVHLKDLISLNEALPDYVNEDKINLSKLQHLYSNINDLLYVKDTALLSGSWLKKIFQSTIKIPSLNTFTCTLVFHSYSEYGSIPKLIQVM